MPQFRKKAVLVEAIQLRWSTWNDVCAFVGDTINPDSPGREITATEASDTCGEAGPSYLAFDVTTVHGEKATVRHGDWIIPDGKPGTFYPCKPDIFAATYESALAPGGVPASVTREQDRDIYHSTNLARSAIKNVAEGVAELRQLTMDVKAGNSETVANITLCYRHLEDASMRLGKALQSIDGGVSVYDKKTTVGA